MRTPRVGEWLAYWDEPMQIESVESLYRDNIEITFTNGQTTTLSFIRAMPERYQWLGITPSLDKEIKKWLQESDIGD